MGFFNHRKHGSRLAWSSPATCAEDERSDSEGSRAERKAFERTSRNAAKWTQGTAKGYESCLWKIQPYKFRNTFQFFIYAFGILAWGLGWNPRDKRVKKKITVELWSNSAERTFVTISVSRNARFRLFRGEKKLSDRGFICWMILGASAALYLLVNKTNMLLMGKYGIMRVLK